MKNARLLPLVLGIVIGALISYFYFGSQTTDDDQKVQARPEPTGLISPEEARTMDMAFNSRHQLISDSITKRPDNRSSWWALDNLRSYLDYAENEAMNQDYTMDGIRVYLAAYPNEGEEVGYTTMFFVPTGISNASKGSMFNFNYLEGSGDISTIEGFNNGGSGNPPDSNYPQQ